MYTIAIDGPSSAGKSSVAKALAEKLNILHLNTGALYRAVGLYAYQNGLASKLDDKGIPVLSQKEINSLIKNTKVTVKFLNAKQHTFLNGDDVTDLLYTPIISDYSSRVSAITEIRNHILELQRDIAQKNNVVIEGRDIASHVIPGAKYKFFVTASPEVRAERRFNEMMEKGILCTYEEILDDLRQRDIRDTTRKISPLVIVPDAVVIDTSDMSLLDVVDKILSYIKE